MTTNIEWLYSLASTDASALNAWFDSEHVEGANGTSDALSDGLGAKSCDCTDSREKLKAENALLLDANARLQRSLAEASEERESCREKFGEALDYAAAILRLAD